MPGTTAPTDEELKDALTALRAENATLGVSKLHALLLSTKPEWSVSEKRTRKIVQSAGLTVAPARTYPRSRVLDDLDVSKWTKKVAVQYFGPERGKGLVVKEEIQEDEAVWKEDPWIVAPEWEVFDMQRNGRACAFCTTPFNDPRLVVPCADSSSAAFCGARFCNRLCLTRAAGGAHALVCAARNPASAPLVGFARQVQWQAPLALALAYARLLGAAQRGEQELRAEWKTFMAFAELSQEERAKDPHANWGGAASYQPEAWKRLHGLLLNAFKTPAAEADRKKLARILKKPLPEDIEQALFSFEGFLHNLGRMNLNLESHGGLYVLHSHINHSCNPNASVRHLDQRTALAKITIVAKRLIAPGEELTISYVDPSMPVKQRRMQLGEYGFGKCTCERCVAEEKAEKETAENGKTEDTNGKAEENGDGKAEENGEGKPDLEDLERELKEGLGVA